MIQLANTVSLLSGAETNAAATSVLPGETTDSAAFTENLLQQLNLLQKTVQNGGDATNSLLSGLPAANGLPNTSFTEQDLQNFAALFGKSLPAAKNSSQEINLDDTMSALANVLQYLQNIKTGANTSNSAQAGNNASVQANQINPVANNAAESGFPLEELNSFGANNASSSAKGKPVQSNQADVMAAMAANGLQMQLPPPAPTVNASANQPQPISLNNINQTTLVSENYQTGVSLNKQAGNTVSENNQQQMTALQQQLQSLPQPMLQQQPQRPQPAAQSAPSAQSPVQLPASVSNMLAAMSGSLVVSANQNTGAANNLSPSASDAAHAVQSGAAPAGAAQTNSAQLAANPVAQPDSENNVNISAAVTTVAGAVTPAENTQTNVDSDFAKLMQSLNLTKNEASATSQASMPVNIAQLNQPVNTENAKQLPAMSLPLNHPDWNSELAGKLQQMQNQNMPTAELQINPPHLGALSIKIGIEQNQTTVTFTTQHSEVKQAIEASLPKLQEMLGNQQINLLDVNVSQQQADQKPAQGFFQMGGGQGGNNSSGSGNNSANSGGQQSGAQADETEAGNTSVSNGLLNLFA
ncbi:MAG: flagellar hook-length control protein FliK [Methylomonas sp.]|jgi:flagellar hook-length control protein FliK